MLLTTNTVLSGSILVTSNTKVIDLIYHAALAHNSMKDTKFKIVSTQTVQAIELLLYNFNFTHMLLETRDDIQASVTEDSHPTHNVINHHQMMPNAKFEVVCQYEHNTAIRNTAS